MLPAEYSDMQPIEGARREMWWEALKGFPDGVVLAAATRHIASSKWKPQLADILALCQAQDGGGWLGADEAWALMPKTEDESAMLTQEIAEAITAATPLLEMGDKVAARMAFKDCYSRLVERARIEGRQPRYFPSFGTDPHGRVQMLARAVQSGQVTMLEAARQLPEYANQVITMAGIDKKALLAGPEGAGIVALLPHIAAPETPPEKARENLAKIKAMIANGGMVVK